MTDYPVRIPFETRWRDNDQYGHVNNVVYYEAMDTAVNAWMIRHAGLDPAGGGPIALVVASNCRYLAPASFPEPLEVGVSVGRLGTTSVTWALGILRAAGGVPHGAVPGVSSDGSDASGETIATGEFVHVFVDAATRRPVPVPAGVREAFAAYGMLDRA
ncbi:acyl-CoA thioesterase [Agromyces archimandritae]|uniref:Acyl-CoA thioesterase n=1 Tax=Agromyces archimandritae TaxID=2781962 RepID=A0A975FPI1_9MICO|nr:thioesterase family protein [Agromyces archimandritae]QTX05995.1 acyl-CoA thioesterase [Agromyces archimandritae]